MSERTFHRTTVTLTVLSDEPVDDYSLRELLDACDAGPCVGDVTGREAERITGKELADALYQARSEPGFFGLDDDGDDNEEW